MTAVAALAAALAFAADAKPGAGLSPEAGRELQQVGMMLRYVAGEYGIAVKNGKVVNPDEYAEMTGFSTLARDRARAAAAGHPAAGALHAELAGLAAAVARKDAPARVGARIETALGMLTSSFGIRLAEAPSIPPDPAEGERVYRENCAACHGVSGNGRGPVAAKVSPAPADFTDREFMALETPLDFFNVVNVGVANTVMPAWHGVLSEREIWSAVFWVWRFQAVNDERGRGRAVLRRNRKTMTLPDAQRFVSTSDAELGTALGGGLSEDDRRAVVAWLRAEPASIFGAGRPADHAAARAGALDACRIDLGRARERYAAGNRTGALQAVVGAYLEGFERVEMDVANTDPALAREIEMLFGRLREVIQAGRPAPEIESAVAAVEAGLDRAGRAAAAGLSAAAAFGQSLLIIVREGFEIILVLAALSTYLIRVGQREKTLWLYSGAGVAIAASLVVAGLARWVLSLTPAHQEFLEGVTMLLAAVVLFYMSHWILSRAQAEKWNRYIQQTASKAVKAGSLWTLAGVGFLVVFREGVETVLFYQSLSFAAPGAGDAIWVGFGVGCIALLLIAIAMFQLGLRMPLRPFFVATSVLLYVLVFIFTGNGIHELQAGGYLPATGWSWLPSIPLLGVHPTLESLIPQTVLAVVGLMGLRVIRGAGGVLPPMNGTMTPIPAHEQLLAIQSLATRLRERAEAGADHEVANLARQLEAAAKSERP